MPLILEHVRRLRLQPQFTNSLLVACPESNLGMEAEHMRRIFDKKVKYCIVMREAKGQAGMLTTHGTKETMCNLFSERLDEHAVHIHSKLVCVKSDIPKILKELYLQMSTFSIIVDVPGM